LRTKNPKNIEKNSVFRGKETVSAVPRSNQSVNSQRVELLEALIGFIMAHPDEQTGV
jgi:hypothetical protein